MLLDKFTASPHFYPALAAAAAALALFNIFEVLFLVRHKKRLDRMEARKERLRRRITEALLAEGDPAALVPPPSRHEDYEAYSEAIASITDTFDGEIAARAAGLARSAGVDAYYRGLYDSRAWYKRAHAADTLSALKLDGNRAFFETAFAAETSPEVGYRLIFGLSQLARNAADLLALARRLSSLPYLTPKYTEDVFYSALSALRAAGRGEEFLLFLEEVRDLSEVLPLVKRDAISACAASSCDGTTEAVKAYFAAFGHEPEILIACLKILGKSGDFSRVLPALQNRDWRVQLTGLKYAHLCGDEALPEIHALLKSGNYHVRLQAARALAAHGATGLSVLRSAAASADRFAAEAARYALAEAGGGA